MPSSAAVLLALLTVCCGNGPAPSPSRPSVSGEWVGQYRLTDCSSSGGDFRHCGDQHMQSPYTIRLVLQQRDDRVTGTAEIRSAFFAGDPIPVTGRADQAGTLTMTGGMHWNPPSRGNTVTDGVDLSGWTSTIGAGATTMTGRFTQDTAGWYGFESVRFTSRLDGDIITLVKR
jgi:hypothetical protein